MIRSEIFRASRDNARLQLSPEEASNSFGYYIDIANDWENYRSYEDLIPWFGIHSTHVDQFQELVHNLGQLSDKEIDWINRYVIFIDRVARLMTTSGARTDLRYDLAETLTDWRHIRQFIDMPAKILDFGAGCGRQALAAFLFDPKNIYTAVDGTLAGYTIQNIMFACMDVHQAEASTYDLLDNEVSTVPYPEISAAKQGDRFHVPVWMAEEKLPRRFYDVMIAAHVHNELSGYDFLRLLNCANKCLTDNGILYLRSEIYVADARDFFDAVDLHAMETTGLLREQGFVPVWCRHDTFLTTVFAREGSTYHQNAKSADTPETGFLEVADNRSMSALAAENFTKRQMASIAGADARIAVVGGPNSFLEDYVKPVIETSNFYTDDQILGDSEFRDALFKYNPTVIIIPSHNCGALEAAVKELFEPSHFAFRQHYFFPIVYLFTKDWIQGYPLFESAIRTPSDLGIDVKSIPTHSVFET